jgi:hypothetical protein
MMTNQFRSRAEYYRAQLREFREDDEARWKYEAEARRWAST